MGVSISEISLTIKGLTKNLITLVDPEYGKRLFFENSGGSLRLKKCVEAKAEFEITVSLPINPMGIYTLFSDE